MGTINLNDLGVFVAVVETASFSEAAKRLKVPKSSVSRAVVRLESAMGARVLHRTTRHVAPSTAGRALFEKVRTDIASLRDSLGDLPELEEEPAGRIRVSAPESIRSFLAEVVGSFIARYRRVEVEMCISNEHVDLVSQGFDLALRATRKMKDSSLTARRLCYATLYAFASPSYVARQGMPRTPRDLSHHEWVVFSRQKTDRMESDEGTVEVVQRGRMTCDDFGFMRDALVQGCGIGYLPPHMAEADIAAGRLVRVLPKWRLPPNPCWAVWPGTRQLPRKVSAFLEMVVAGLAVREIW
jgi:DNA-binding transcriptional LysR family regulator